MSQGLGSEIISKFEFPKFLTLLTNLSYDILTKAKELESEDRSIVEYCILTIASILLY